MKAKKVLPKELQGSAEVIINSLPGNFYIYDDRGNMVMWNRDAEKTTGYSGKEMSRMKPLDFFTGDDRKTISDAMIEVLRKDNVVVEVDLVTKSGRKIPYQFTGRRIKLGGRTYLMGMGMDISRIRKNEEKMRESRERFHEFFEKMPDAVIIMDRKGTFLEISDEAEKVSGYGREEMINKNLFSTNLLDTKTKLLIVEKLAFHFGGGKVQPFEIDIRRKDGNIVPLEINPAIIDYMGKKADLVVLRDVTERTKANEELRRSKMELESKVTELEKFSKLSVGRELKMIELKKRIKELEKVSGTPDV